MSITTCAELKTAGQAWLDRQDIAANFEDFIPLFEASFNRNIRTREMLTSATITTTAGVGTLPTDFLQVIAVTTVSSTEALPLGELEADEFYARYGDAASDTPKNYIIQGSEIFAAPVDDTQPIGLVYYAKLDPLVADTDTNWLLASHPDAYLFGVLVEAEAFNANPQAAALWKQRRDEVMREVQLSGQFYRGPSPQIRSARGFTP